MADAATESKNDNSTKNIVRIGVGVVLVILVVLAVMDRNAKSAASESTTAWLDALQSATSANTELKYSDLSQHTVGNPEKTGDPASGSVVFTWKGTLRSYTTTVGCEGTDPPVVIKVEGPSS